MCEKQVVLELKRLQNADVDFLKEIEIGLKIVRIIEIIYLTLISDVSEHNGHQIHSSR